MGPAQTTERILAGWAHDLGKPLQVIACHGRRLTKRSDLDDPSRRFAHSIVKRVLVVAGGGCIPEVQFRFEDRFRSSVSKDMNRSAPSS